LKQHTQKILPYRAYVLPFIFLALIGLLDSFYLSISHYRNYTDISYSSFCALSKAINCDTVSQSPWSIFVGIPLAQWGMLAFMLIIFIALSTSRDTPNRKMLWHVIFFLSALYILADMYFAYITVVKIHAYCVLCLLSYVVNFSLLFSSWIIRRRFKLGSFFSGLKEGTVSIWKNKSLLLSIVLLFALFGCVKIFLPHYWVYELPPLSENVATGFTEDSHPWIGARHPDVIIEEFTDYQCFQCSNMHLILRSLISKYPNKIRLIHHHYPLDNKFNPLLGNTQSHEGSGQMALLAIAAGKQNKFWQANDFLYSIARQKLKELNIYKFAAKLGISSDKIKSDMYAQDTLKLLEQDLDKGLKNKMLGTPSFIIDGKVYQGIIPQDVFEKLLL
jgi:uncharacterized membrane protein/protein-disulfide isomerase